MLQRFLIIALTLCSLTATAQWQQTGSKVRYVNGLGIPTKDTAAGVSADSSQILIRPADSSLYIKYKRTWVKVGSGGTIGGSGTAGQVSFFTGASAISGDNALFWDNTNKRLGINTVTPGVRLDIHGTGVIQQLNGTTTNNAYLDYQNAGSTQWRIGNQYAAASNRYSIFNAAGTTEVFTIIQGGNVGINRTSPNYSLDVNGTGFFTSLITSGATSPPIKLISSVNGTYGGANFAQYFRADGTTNRAYIGYGQGNDQNFQIATQESGGILQFKSGAEILALTLGSNQSAQFAGDVGIGYTAPAAKLAVSGTTLINTNTDNGVDKLQVSGGAIASTLKVNTSGQTVNISSYYNGGAGNHIWIGGGGLSSTSTAAQNTSVGVGALLNITSSQNNVAFGKDAGKAITSGDANTAIGTEALLSNNTGYRNVSIGPVNMLSNTSGYENMSIGTLGMAFNTTGYKNVSIGSSGLYENTTGYSNIAFGFEAGRRISGGSANQTSNTSIYIGEDTRSSANGNTNEMVFGHTAIGQGSNTVTLGNSSITKTFLRGNTMVNTTTDNGVDELQVNGSISGIGFKQAYVTKTGAYTATNDDYVIDCTSGTFTVTLPASSGRTGRILIIKNSGAGTITVDGNASETIDGAATYAISVQYGTIQIMSDGTNWKIIAKF